MTYTRWYDRDKYLKLLMETLEHLDENLQKSVASDLIQMIIQEKGEEADIFLDQINAEYSPIKRRWYDKEENIKSAVEMLKYIDEEERIEVINEILYSILQYKKNERPDNNNDIT